jgi:maltose alpha-D-glucosyltransferase/alpha-amylase
MQAMYLAFARGDAGPIAKALRQRPALDLTSQWANFLRNHDELTVSPLAEADRTTVLDAFAPDPQARVLGGIRRRVAPMLGNDPRRIEMVNGMLFSLPGTPVIYYGDEIAMGDNVLLRDRDSVRTPMQWVAGKGAGFSTADPSKFPLPVVSDPQYAPDVVNVERQQGDPTSMLSRMKRIIAARKEHPALRHGDGEVVPTGTDGVLGIVRRADGEQVLALTNVTDQVQHVQVPARLVDDGRAIHVQGSEAPAIEVRGDTATVTVQPYGYHWLASSEQVR